MGRVGVVWEGFDLGGWEMGIEYGGHLGDEKMGPTMKGQELGDAEKQLLGICYSSILSLLFLLYV